jgi:hypothetical protein
MPRDIPTEEKSVRERGTYAGHGGDPTLASYLSSLFLLLSVPTFVPAFAGLLVASLAVAFALMHVRTGR